MSDVIIVALITNGTVIIVALLSRLWSHLEHKETSKQVRQIQRALNGLPNDK